MADEPAELETRMERLERKLDELLSATGPTHAAAQAHEEKHLNRPTSIAEMVQQELDAKEAKARDAAEKEAAKSEAQQIREQIAALTEQKPAAPQPRRQRVMWGAR